MRPCPDYPPYRQARPPSLKRWLTSGALCLFAVASVAALLNRDAHSVLKGSLVVVLTTGLLGLLRLLYYRASVHHAHYYQRLVDQQQQQWWAQHCQTFALQETVLLGPAGSERNAWLALLQHRHRLPPVREEPGGKALRVAQILSTAPAERERQLARLLALQWQKQRDQRVLPVLQQCYWAGSLDAWRAFCSQLSQQYPSCELPTEPLPWQGEETLSAIAEAVNTGPETQSILVAGCCSMPAEGTISAPAGEAAVLWLIGRSGTVAVSRGEIFSPGQQETVSAVCQRALRQGGLKQPPETCMLFSQPQSLELTQCGWNMTHHLQDANWGNVGPLAPLVTLTLAALWADTQRQPCGWLAADPQYPLVLGVINPAPADNASSPVAVKP